MKYDCEIIINKPLDEVLTLFKDEKNLYQWMEGLKSIEPISGTKGQEGYKCKMVFEHKGREMEMEETNLKMNLPEEARFAYVSPMGYNEVGVALERITDTQTRYKTDNYFKLKGVMRLLAPLMKGSFKKQSMKYLTAFKNFAEGA